MSIATLSAATGGRADDIHRHARTAAAAEVERTTTCQRWGLGFHLCLGN